MSSKEGMEITVILKGKPGAPDSENRKALKARLHPLIRSVNLFFKKMQVSLKGESLN